MRDLPPFAPLKAFFAAAETGRFRTAAELLGLTESAVSHQVKRLEQHLGAALFERDGRRLRLSSAGARYHREIRPAFAAIQSATAEFANPKQHRVTLTLPTSIASFWLLPRLSRWQEAHPEIDLQVLATNRLCDLAREQLDLGLRYGAGQWPGCEVRLLMPEQYFPVASADFLARHRGIDPAALLQSVRIINNVLHPDEWAAWCAAHGVEPPRRQSMLNLASAELVVPAILDGVGIGMGRRPIIDPLLACGRLLPLFKGRRLQNAAYYLVWPQGRQNPPHLRAVVDWLTEEGKSSDIAPVEASKRRARGKGHSQ